MTIETPDRALDKAFECAKVGIEMLKTEQPGKVIGVYVGYPWLANLWGRDTGWILLASLSIGDLEWAKKSILTLLRDQADHDYDILAALKGEIPSIQGYRSQFLYGAADATLYYPILIP